MSLVYSTRFLAQQGLQGNITYVVPVGYRLVLKNWSAYTDATAPGQTCYIKDDTNGNLLDVADAPVTPGKTMHIQQLGYVMEAGETLQIVGGLAFVVAWDVMACGYLLTLP